MKNKRLYPAVLRTNMVQQLQHRVAYFTGSVNGIVWAAIEIVVYRVFYTYAAHADAGIIAGMTLAQVSSYAWLVQVFFAMQFGGTDEALWQMVNDGNIGLELCRPVDFYFYWYAKTLATKLVRTVTRGLPTILAGIAAHVFACGLQLPASPALFCLFLLAVCCAFLQQTAWNMVFTAVRMDVEVGSGTIYLLQLIPMVISGGYLPLQLWPDFLQKFLFFQPFSGGMDLPLRMYIGTIGVPQAIIAIGLQIGWTAVFMLLGRGIVKSRLRTVVVQGG